MIFKDRYDAALNLIPLLEKYRKETGVVLAVPRGGVPIGYHIARAFHFPLELLLTKKIGHPASKELAIGAVSLVSEVIDDRHHVPEEYIEHEIKKIRESLRERYKKFVGDREPEDLQGKTVIIVDDGIATGNTIMASIKMIRTKHPKKIVIAVPVAPAETAARLRAVVDDFVCCHTPKHFFGVGQFYEDFSEVSDQEVIDLMKEINHKKEAA
jgi:predicted phosphoribosyltransferase